MTGDRARAHAVDAQPRDAGGRVSRISRRRLLHGVGTLGVALAAGCGPGPLTVAPPSPRLRRIGVLMQSAAGDVAVEALRRGLGDLGYVEGRDFEFHERNSQGDPERLPAFASELVKTPVDVIVASGSQSALTAKAATSTIPIVSSFSGDVVQAGLVSDLARPGGNVTGVTVTARKHKHLELLKETLPGLVRVAHLGDARTADLDKISRDALEDCRTLGLVCLGNVITPGAPAELELALQNIERFRPDALFVWVGTTFLGAAGFDRVLAFAVEHRLPQLFLELDSARRGGLIGMTSSRGAGYRIVARQVDRILKGANPGDLPVEENMFFDVVLNRSMARKIGLSFPDSTLRRATEIVD